MSFETAIGSRYLRAKKQHAIISLITFLSVAGVTVGVMALIVVIAVMSGFEADLKSRILGVEPHLIVERVRGPFLEHERVRRILHQQRGVDGAAPFIATQVMLRSASGVSGAVLRGIEPDASAAGLSRLFDPALLLSGGDGASPGIVMGQDLARRLGLVEGERLYVISPRGSLSPVGHIPAMKRFRLAGLFSAGMYEYDGAFAYIRLGEAQKMLHMGGAVSGVEARVRDIDVADRIGRRMAAELGPDFRVRDWMQMNRNLFSALKLEKTVMFLILALIVLVAAFNIAGSLVMMVMEKKKDIAILKAMGATDGSIRKIFVFNGMVIGTIGTALGAGLGFLLCFLLERYQFVRLPGDVYYITTLPVRLAAFDVVVIALAALGICFLATLYPSRKAARLNPIEAIRYG